MRFHNNYNLSVAKAWLSLQSWLTCEWVEIVGLEMFKVKFLVDWGDHYKPRIQHTTHCMVVGVRVVETSGGLNMVQ